MGVVHIEVGESAPRRRLRKVGRKFRAVPRRWRLFAAERARQGLRILEPATDRPRPPGLLRRWGLGVGQLARAGHRAPLRGGGLVEELV